MLENLKKIFKNPKYLISYFILVLLLGLLWYYFTDFGSMLGNYGLTRVLIDSFFSWVNILGFPLFIVAWIYRSYNFGSVSGSDNVGFIGGFISAIISGSLCCGSSLLIPLGASIFIDFFSKNFPYGGLELKIVGVIILLYGLYKLLKNLTTCQMKLKKK